MTCVVGCGLWTPGCPFLLWSLGLHPTPWVSWGVSPPADTCPMEMPLCGPQCTSGQVFSEPAPPHPCSALSLSPHSLQSPHELFLSKHLLFFALNALLHSVLPFGIIIFQSTNYNLPPYTSLSDQSLLRKWNDFSVSPSEEGLSHSLWYLIYLCRTPISPDCTCLEKSVPLEPSLSPLQIDVQ